LKHNPERQNSQEAVGLHAGYFPGWADAKFALNAPGDNENAGNGPPFAQIVSQNQNGTYSLNYRNEPVPFESPARRI